MAWETLAKLDDEEEVKTSDWSVVGSVDEPDEPVEPEVVEEEGDVYSGPYHALKGYGKMLAGMGDLPNLVATVGTYPHRKLANALGVDEKYTDAFVFPALTTQPFMKDTMEWLDKTEGVKEGSPWDLAQTAVEWGGLGPISAMRKGATWVPDALMALGATTGQATGGDTGEVIGGLTGLLASLRGGRAGNRAVDLIEGGDDEMLARVEAGVANGEAGTTADLAGTQHAADVEAGVRGGSNSAEYERKEIQRQQQIADEIRAPFGDADPNTAQVALKDRINRIYDRATGPFRAARTEQIQVPFRAKKEEAAQLADQAGLEKAAAEAAAREAEAAAAQAARVAEESRLPLATDETLAQTSTKMKDRYLDERKSVYDTEVQPLWDMHDDLPEMDITEYKKIQQDWWDSLSPADKESVEIHQGLTRPFRHEEITKMRPNQIQSALSDIKLRIDNARNKGEGYTNIDKLEELYDALRGQLGRDVPEFEAAMAAHSRVKARFDNPYLKNAADKEGELFARTLGQGDEHGALTVRLLNEADIPGMPALIADRLKALARRSMSGIDDVFVAEYESIMDGLPVQLREQVDNLVAADKASATAASTADLARKQANAVAAEAEKVGKKTEIDIARADKEAAKANAALDKRISRLTNAVARSNAARYVENPTKTLNSMLKNPDNMEDLVQLGRSMDSVGEGASFTAKMGDVILDRLSKGGNEAGLRRATGAGRVLDAAAIEEFHKIGKSLVNAGIPPESVDEIRRSVYKLATKAQKAKARHRMIEDTHFMQDLLASGTAAWFLNLVPGNSLVLAGAVRRGIKAMMSASGAADSKVIAAIDDFMLNPEKYVAAAKNAKSPERAQQLIMSELVAASQVASQN